MSSSGSKLSLTQYKKIYGRPALGKLAVSVGSDLDYFDLLARENSGRKPGLNLVKKLVGKYPELFDHRSLRPNDF